MTNIVNRLTTAHADIVAMPFDFPELPDGLPDQVAVPILEAELRIVATHRLLTKRLADGIGSIRDAIQQRQRAVDAMPRAIAEECQ